MSLLGKHVGFASDNSALAQTTHLNFEAALMIFFLYLFIPKLNEGNFEPPAARKGGC